ncbi:hypothetical protein ACFL6U_09410 [Planctomycetota bacterium]
MLNFAQLADKWGIVHDARLAVMHNLPVVPAERMHREAAIFLYSSPGTVCANGA